MATEVNTAEDVINGRMPVHAVPSDGMHAPYDGITKRELFAAMAMQGILSAGQVMPNEAENAAHWAVIQADALLKELAK